MKAPTYSLEPPLYLTLTQTFYWIPISKLKLYADGQDNDKLTTVEYCSGQGWDVHCKIFICALDYPLWVGQHLYASSCSSSTKYVPLEELW